MTPRIEEKIKEGKLRLARKLKFHQCSVVTTANALLIMEETIADVIEAQKQSDVEVLEGLKESSVCTHYQDNCSCLNAHDTKIHNTVLDQAIENIKV